MLGEGELASGPVQAKCGPELTGRHPLQDRVGDRGPVGGPLGETLPEQAQAWFMSVSLQV